MPLHRTLVSIAVLSAAAAQANAQARAPAPRPAVVRVTVTSMRGNAIPDVDLVILRNDDQAILLGRSDSAGRSIFRVEVDRGKHYSIIARKIGFAPARSAIQLVPGDTLNVDVELEAAAPTDLPSVRIEARKTDHYLEATEIANSHRAIYNAFDAIRKLRPYMLGDPDRCPRQPTDNVWLNGRRVLFMASSQPDPGGPRSFGRTYRSPVPHIDARRGRLGPGGSPALDSALAGVRVEHIAEIRWVDCRDHSMPGVGMNNAIFIVLKPGIDYDWKNGSYPADSVPGSRADRKRR